MNSKKTVSVAQIVLACLGLGLAWISLLAVNERLELGAVSRSTMSVVWGAGSAFVIAAAYNAVQRIGEWVRARFDARRDDPDEAYELEMETEVLRSPINKPR
jgi:hypothetical protein